MKIAIVIARYAIAGVPLAQIRLANALAGRGHEVKLVVGCIDSEIEFPQDVGVDIIVFSKSKARHMLFSLMSYLRNEKPDIVFSAEDHLNIIMLLASILVFSKAKISCSSRVTPFDTYSDIVWTKGWLLKCLFRLVMWRANVLTCVSEDMVLQYKTIFPSAKHICVYNIVADSRSRERMNEYVDRPWLVEGQSVPTLVAAGRLAPWKGFADLIEAVYLLRDKEDVRLLILGDGPLRGDLQKLINKRGLNQIIELVGNVENPLKFFSRSKIFVLSSLVEGLPNVLVEAMMCGCTPVSTDCPTGPREVLNDGVFGYLVPPADPHAIANAIRLALTNPISKNILSSAVSPFEENAVIEKHFQALELCTK